jgi:hypothetical protein
VKERGRQRKRKDKSDRRTKKKAKPKFQRMSNTTVFVLCVAVPLLLGGFINFYAHKPWILYFPLGGLLMLVGYIGHLAIQSYAYPQNKSEGDDSARLEMKDERPNVNISSRGQSGGFTGINRGTVNLGTKKREITAEQEANILRDLENAPKGKIEMTVIESDQEAVALFRRIESILKKARYDVNAWTAMMLSGPQGAPVGLGMTIQDPNSPPIHAQAVLEAFAKAGLNPLTSINSDRDPHTLYIVIGANPIE